MIGLTVIVPTHNPSAARLSRTLASLQAQTLPEAKWECLLVDNASRPPLALADWQAHGPANLRLVPEPVPGLSYARRRGFLEAGGEILVLVDDDNELAPDYLANVLALFAAHPNVGVMGGRSFGWTLLASRMTKLRVSGSIHNEVPVKPVCPKEPSGYSSPRLPE